MSLTERELDWCTAVEQLYLLHGIIPEYKPVDKLIRCTEAYHNKMLQHNEARAHLEQRGVPVGKFVRKLPAGYLSPEQLVAINTLLDFNDTRSDTKKLKDLGISSQTYAAWKKDPNFKAYIQERAENMFGDNMDEFHRALIDSGRSGDISAIKLIYELTGRYNPRSESNVDVRAIMTQMLEIITKRVRDPDIIKAIAADFQLIAIGSQVAGGNIPRNAGKIIESVAERKEIA